jgi:multiple sugar transport system permease protein
MNRPGNGANGVGGATLPAQRPNYGRRALTIAGRLSFHAVLLLGCVVVLLPFVWMISTSLKDEGSVFIFPPRWIPHPVVWSNYPDSWNVLPMGMAYLNSIKITTLVTLGGLFTCSLAAYPFAKMRFPGRDILFIALLATLMIPQQVTLIPLFIMFKQVHWIDTHWPLIVPPILQNPYGVFLLRQFFRTIPSDLEDAARIDGASPWTIYRKIIIPLAKPALIALGIFIFLYNWNLFLTPLIYLSSQDKFTVPVLLTAFQADYNTQWALLMAASTVALVPVLVVYIIGQRYFIEGIALTGLKG